MPNPYYDHTTVPATGASLSSSQIRNEFDLVEAGFDKMPTLSGNGGLPIFVSAGATALEAISASSARTKLGLVIGTDVQAYDADLAALAGLASAADKVPYFTGSGTAAVADFTAYGRSVVAVASEAAFKTLVNLEIGTDVQAYDAELAALAGLTSAADKVPYFTGIGTASVADFTAYGRSVVAVASEAAFKALVNLEIGTDVQAFDADLSAIAALAKTDGNFIVGDGSAWVAESGATARNSLGLGTIATQASSSVTITGGSITGITDLAVADGGTGASDASTARTNLGLVIGTNVQAFDSDLSAIAGLAANGLIARTASGTASVRTITAPAAGITVSDGDGVAGNPTLVLANDLAALEGLASTGIAVRTASDTWAQRTITGPAAGISVTNGNGVSGNPTLALANDLSAVEGLAANGLATRTATDTWTVRTITGPAAGITVTNGDGVSGNPTLALANDLAALEGLGSTGIAVRSAADTWVQRTLTAGAGIGVTNGDGVSGNPTVAISSAVARLDTADQALTGGVIVTSNDLGTVASGTVTPDPGDRPLQHYTNNGAHTLGVSANAGSILLDITNGASAGAITTSGFTKVAGDSFTTTSGHKFRCVLTIGNGGSLLIVQALQ